MRVSKQVINELKMDDNVNIRYKRVRVLVNNWVIDKRERVLVTSGKWIKKGMIMFI